MRVSTTLALLLSLYTWVQPTVAEACSCGGHASAAQNYRSAAAVFVGIVEDVSSDFPQRGTATLLVTAIYKGSLSNRTVVTRDCGMNFLRGSKYLVYAHESGGQLDAGFCTRTRPVSAADEDIRYLENLLAGTPQALVHGEVLRAITNQDGSAARQALFESLNVVAVSVRERRAVVTDQWGPYQLVLAPGDYDIWVERAGRRVTPREKLHLRAGDEHRMSFTAKY